MRTFTPSYASPSFHASWGNLGANPTDTDTWVDDAGYVFLVSPTLIQLLYKPDGSSANDGSVRVLTWGQGTDAFNAVWEKIQTGRRLTAEEKAVYAQSRDTPGWRPPASVVPYYTPASPPTASYTAQLPAPTTPAKGKGKKGKGKGKKKTSLLDHPAAPIAVFVVGALVIGGIAVATSRGGKK